MKILNKLIEQKTNNKYHVYHGTSSVEPIVNFDYSKLKEKSASQLGFFFTNDEFTASIYDDNVFEYEIEINKPYKMSSNKWDNLRSSGYDPSYFKGYREQLISNGYDGIIIEPMNEYSSTYYVVFDPNNIKHLG